MFTNTSRGKTGKAFRKTGIFSRAVRAYEFQDSRFVSVDKSITFPNASLPANVLLKLGITWSIQRNIVAQDLRGQECPDRDT